MGGGRSLEPETAEAREAAQGDAERVLAVHDQLALEMLRALRVPGTGARQLSGPPPGQMAGGFLSLLPLTLHSHDGKVVLVSEASERNPEMHTCQDCDIVTTSRDEIEAHEMKTGHEVEVAR